MPPNKLRKVGVHALLGTCSDAVLSLIIRTLADGEYLARSRIADDLRSEVQQLMASVPLPSVDGGEILWEFLEPNRLLAHVVEGDVPTPGTTLSAGFGPPPPWCRRRRSAQPP